MVIVTCGSCGATKEFAGALTVGDESVDGWSLTVTGTDERLVITSAECEECCEEYEERRDENIIQTIEAARYFMSVNPTPRDIQDLCEYDGVPIARIEELMEAARSAEELAEDGYWS